jgi:hypothetical protein
VLRHYLGGQSYSVEAFATADDFMDADGVAILDFDRAQAEALKRMVSRAHGAAGVAGPLTVKDAIGQYLDWLTGERGEAAVYDARRRAQAFIIPKLGDMATPIRAWSKDITDTLRSPMWPTRFGRLHRNLASSRATSRASDEARRHHGAPPAR